MSVIVNVLFETPDELVTCTGEEPVCPFMLKAATCPMKDEGKPKVTELSEEELFVVWYRVSFTTNCPYVLNETMFLTQLPCTVGELAAFDVVEI